MGTCKTQTARNMNTSALLQVADIFDTKAAEAPIHRLVSVLNTQAAQIHELQETLRVLQSTQRQTVAECTALRAVVTPLEPRVQSTENDLVALTQFHTATQRQLEDINQHIRGKADRQEVRDVEVRAKTSTQQLGKELRSEFAPLKLVQCLQTEQNELHERVENVDRRLTSKMDKSESTQLDGVLVQIHGFRPMAAQLSAQVKSVQLQQEQLERAVSRLDSQQEGHQIELEAIRNHSNGLQHMLEDIEDRHDQVDVPKIQRLDNTTDNLQQVLEEIKTAAATREAALRTLSAKFHSSAGSLTMQLQQQHRHFEGAVAHISAVLQKLLHEKASRMETNAQLAKLNHQVSAKATYSAHKTLSSDVKELLTRFEELQKHVELSTRFLDWFARRGEAYEHNLELVEMQLGRLAVESHPRSREPFGERVRFPRSP
ncbi:hypothetical protein P3T76_005814 [Phytophthora citrophthora]|uniref:Uncharacterized protein n=1 Tax=Phytophthora citrophthora TaxID=4793 RepID=A0AAD9LQ00_9STRA|nr:hypothetical protein P3T76_005814 [Phytophthora citrophthora]